MPNLIDDFGRPHTDIVQFTRADGKERVYLDEGMLVLRPIGDNLVPSLDTHLLHEIGHLLTRPVKTWWEYTIPAINFRFKIPRTPAGVRQACLNELRATGIEHALAQHYWPEYVYDTGADVRITSFGHTLARGMGKNVIEPSWAEREYRESRLPIGTIHWRWATLMQELRERRVLWQTYYSAV